jgi:hypothetical protein
MKRSSDSNKGRNDMEDDIEEEETNELGEEDEDEEDAVLGDEDIDEFLCPFDDCPSSTVPLRNKQEFKAHIREHKQREADELKAQKQSEEHKADVALDATKAKMEPQAPSPHADGNHDNVDATPRSEARDKGNVNDNLDSK